MKNLAFLLLALICSTANAASVSFHGHDSESNQECGISYSFESASESVSDVAFYGNGTVASVEQKDLIFKKSIFGGYTKLKDRKTDGAMGAWTRSLLKVYGDLGSPKSFKYEYTSGRLTTGHSRTIDCI